MYTRNRNPSTALSQMRAYLGLAPRGSFFALVSFLERITEGAVQTGRDGPPAREAIRFRHDANLGFPSSDVDSVELRQSPSDDRPLFEVTSTFLGLSGAASPLPSHIVEDVLFDAARTGVQRDFLDVFHHRVLSLLYRAKIRLDPAREHRSDASDPWLQRLLGLAGVHQDPGIALQPKHLMRLIPVLSTSGQGAAALRVAVIAVIMDELPEAVVSVHEFIGSWIDIDEDQQTRLGQANHELGGATMLGKRVFDQRGRFALRVAGLTRMQANEFMEGRPMLDRVRAAVSLVLRDPLEYDLELELRKGEARAMTLGGSRLGESRVSGFSGTEMLRLRNVGASAGANRSLV